MSCQRMEIGPYIHHEIQVGNTKETHHLIVQLRTVKDCHCERRNIFSLKEGRFSKGLHLAGLAAMSHLPDRQDAGPTIRFRRNLYKRATADFWRERPT